MPTDKQLEIIKANVETAAKLSDMQLIMMALAELVMSSDVPPVPKIVLHSELARRAGIKK